MGFIDPKLHDISIIQDIAYELIIRRTALISYDAPTLISEAREKFAKSTFTPPHPRKIMNRRGSEATFVRDQIQISENELYDITKISKVGLEHTDLHRTLA
jgi:hypothetical protein